MERKSPSEDLYAFKVAVRKLKAMKSFFEDQHPFTTKWGKVFLQNSYSKRQTFSRIFEHSWKTTVKKVKLVNLDFLCKKHFIDCFFVLLVVFEKYLENSATFNLALKYARISPCAANQICLRGQFPRRDNLTLFAFESKLIDIWIKLSAKRIFPFSCICYFKHWSRSEGRSFVNKMRFAFRSANLLASQNPKCLRNF